MWTHCEPRGGVDGGGGAVEEGEEVEAEGMLLLLLVVPPPVLVLVMGAAGPLVSLGSHQSSNNKDVLARLSRTRVLPGSSKN